MAQEEKYAGKLIREGGKEKLVITDEALDAFATLAGYDGAPSKIGEKLTQALKEEGQERYQQLFAGYAQGINFLKNHQGGFSDADLLAAVSNGELTPGPGLGAIFDLTIAKKSRGKDAPENAVGFFINKLFVK